MQSWTWAEGSPPNHLFANVSEIAGKHTIKSRVWLLCPGPSTMCMKTLQIWQPLPPASIRASICWCLLSAQLPFFPHYSVCRESIPVWEEDSSRRPWFGVGFVAVWLCGNSLILCLSTNLEKKEQSVKDGAFGHNAGIKSYFLHRTPASAELEISPQNCVL